MCADPMRSSSKLFYHGTRSTSCDKIFPVKQRVLVLTGSFLIDKKSTFRSVMIKQLTQWRSAKHLWLELKIKALIAENLIVGNLAKRTETNPDLREFFKFRINSETPDLTEVTLATLLRDAGVEYILATYDDLFSNRNKIEKALSECDTVFVSATYLKDLSELLPVARSVKRPGNKVVVGGALAGSLCHDWAGDPSIDVLAVGYGEYLVPVLAEAVKNNWKDLKAPARGRLIQKNHTVFLHSGVPETLSLDGLPSPDWKLSEKDNGRDYRMVYYESVRGCPYRCAFCNYPYLFDDKKFRSKSAARIFEDWKVYVNDMKVDYVTCLDSLFTMPKQRLVEFCNLLIENNLKVKWICYARADDLCDESTVEIMVRAGCIHAQIGIESGDQTILNNMSKRVEVEKNKRAIENCRKHGLTSVITLIVGFPGETDKTIQNTYEFLKETRPDFYFLAVLSLRVPGVPILTEENRTQHAIELLDNPFSISPYWKHKTMDCLQATQMAGKLNDLIISERLSLDASVFFNEYLSYRPQLRESLLDFQQRAWKKSFWVRGAFALLYRLLDSFLRRDLRKIWPIKKMDFERPADVAS